MRTLVWYANLCLACIAILALVHSTGTVNGSGTAVRIVKLRIDGVFDEEKAREIYPHWRDGDCLDQEQVGRFVAQHHIDAEVVVAVTALFVAIVNMLYLGSKTA